MAETAQTLIDDILMELLIQSSEQSVQAIEFNTALRYLNRYMDELEARGIDLTWTTLTLPADAVTAPDGAINGIIFNTAKQLADTYDIQLTPIFLEKCNESMKTLRLLGMTVQPTNYQGTLPRGGGMTSSPYDNPFFVGYSDAVDTDPNA